MNKILKGVLIMFAILIVMATLVFIANNHIQREQINEMSNQYDQLVAEKGDIIDDLINIEKDYVKGSTVRYSDFSNTELTDYIELLNKLIDKNKEIYGWTITNELMLKKKGMTDLSISEFISELKEANKNHEDTKTQMRQLLSYREIW